MSADSQSKKSDGRGPSGTLVLAVARGALVLILVYEALAKARSGGGFDGSADEYRLRGLWAVGMVVVGGLAVASIRRGPKQGRLAGYWAVVICLFGIGWAAIKLTRVLLR